MMGSQVEREKIKADGQPADISFITRPNDPQSIPGLSKEISSLGSRPLHHDEDARLELLKKARSLVRSLETPRETMIKHLWAQPTASSVLAIGVECGLFALFAKEGGPRRVGDLAEVLAVEPALLGRLLRHIAAMGYVNEVDEDVYEASNFSKSLAVPIIGDGYPCVVGGCFGGFGIMPNYFIENEYRSPADPRDGPLQRAIGKGMNFMEWTQANPPWGRYFNHHMGGYHQGRPSWMDEGFYPVRERLVAGLRGDDEKAALLVDVGGNAGHDLNKFRRKHPDAPGRLVLQDLPRVIDTIRDGDLDPKIERMAYDFHTEQPIKGARAYYLHSVLHDWRDDVCASILARLTAAMTPGYSKLLVNESVIPARGADWQATSLDMIMMSLFSSKERTEGEWRALLTANGLRVVDIWTMGEGVDSLIECELA